MMKKLAALTALFLCFNAISQELDWQNFDKIKSENLSVRDGKFTSFKVININKFIYTVNITGARISLQTEPPTELKTLFRLQQVDPATTDLKIKKDLTGVEYLKSGLAELVVTMNPSPTEKEIAEQKLLTDFSDKYTEYITTVQSLNSEIFNLKVARIKLVNFAQLDISYDAMKAKVNPIVINDPTDDFTKLILLFNDLTALKKSMDEAALTSDTIDDSFKKAESMHKTINEDQILTIYEETQNLREQLLNAKNFQAIAPPVQADGDFVNYSVTVTPVPTTKAVGHRSPMTFNFDVPVKSGLKVDFSVGPTFSFGSGSRDEKYYFEDTATEGRTVLRKRDNDNFMNPGIAAMMHMYSRSGKNTSWGGMFGVGAGFQSIEDAGVAFYGGLSMIKGKKEKIMVSAGISVFGVERLKYSQYEVDKEYDSTGIAISDVTEKVFKGSFFLSVSYCISNRVESN